MQSKLIASIGLAVFSTTALPAQDSYQWAAPPSATRNAAHFPIGTPLVLVTRTEINSRHSRPGDRVNLEVAQPLMYRGQVVVPAGAPAVGEIRRSEGTAMFGKGGELELRLRYVQTPHGPVRLTGDIGRNGKGQQVLAIGGALFVAWPMLFIRGKSAKFPADTAVTGLLLDDLRFPVDPAAQLAAANGPALAADQLLSGGAPTTTAVAAR